MLTENKFSKYIIYAVGEIVLVVIGILIALTLNTQKELNTNKSQIESIIIGVSKNLENDMKSVDEVIKISREFDSLSKIVLEKKLTASDYQGEVWNNEYIYLTRRTMEIIRFEKSGYDRLMGNIEIIPIEYNPLVEELQRVYGEEVLITTEVETDIRTYLNEIEKNLKDNYDWYSMTDSIHSQQQIDYYLSNSQYFNDVSMLQKYMIHIGDHLKDLKSAITVAYNKIHKELLSDKPFPEHIEQYEFAIPEELIEYTGKYKILKSKPNSLDTLIVKSKEHFLVISPFELSILKQTKDKYQSPRYSEFQFHFYRDKDGEVNSLTLFYNISAAQHKDSLRSESYQKIK
mgnify:CR=1 FL=1